MFTFKDTADIGPFNMHRKFTSDLANDQKLVFLVHIVYKCDA